MAFIINNIKNASNMTMPQKSRFGAAVLKVIWVLTVLIWPLLRIVLAMDCVYQFVRMLYHWNTPGVHAGWTFLFHFCRAVCVDIFCFGVQAKGYVKRWIVRMCYIF
ncbi:MAG: KleE stable inheritance protein [Burkholderiaceae bacterium]